MHARSHETKYKFKNEPIDIVIVSHPKDKRSVDLCIDGILANSQDTLRRIIVVSPEPLSDKAEWFDERKYPFSKADIAVEIYRGDLEAARKKFGDINGDVRTVAWYYQQLLKLYAPFVIPGISSNMLVIDADTIFLNPVKFLGKHHAGLFCVSPLKAKQRYIDHAKRLVPGYERIYPEHYSVCHHMLFQKPILKHLFQVVEDYHHTDFWKAFCRCVNPKKRGASEYEIYYNFALRNSKQVKLRPLKWTNCFDISRKEEFRESGYHFASFHVYPNRINNDPQD